MIKIIHTEIRNILANIVFVTLTNQINLNKCTELHFQYLCNNVYIQLLIKNIICTQLIINKNK